MSKSAIALALLCATAPATADAAAFDEVRIPSEEIRAVEASTTSEEALDGRPGYRTSYLTDGVAWSPWGEGALGDGVGETVTVRFGGTRYLTRIEILNGNLRDSKTWKAHGRAKDILLRFRSSERRIQLVDSQRLQTIDLGSPVETDSVEMEFLTVHSGGAGPMCLSEVTFYEPKDVLAIRPELRAKLDQAVKDLGDPTLADDAVQLLGHVGAPALAWLSPRVEDPSPSIRTRLAFVLGMTGAREAAGLLERVYGASSEPGVREAVLDAFVRLKSPAAVPFLVTIADGGNPVLSRKAILAMEGIGDRRTLKVFLRAVMEGDEALAAVGIRHLAGFGDEAANALRPYVHDKRQSVRARAVWALGRVGGERALPVLIGLMERESLPIVLAAMRGLGETGSRQAFDTLALNVEHENEDVRATVAAAMGNFAMTEAAEILGRFIRRDGSQKVRDAAWASVARVGPPGLAVLKSLVVEGTPPQRDRALTVLENLRYPGTLQALFDLLGSPDVALRKRTIDMIMQRPDGGTKGFVKAMGHEDSSVRFVAVRHLTTIGTAAVPYLVHAVSRSDDPEMRAAALRALAEIGDPRGVDAIQAALAASNRKVRREAIRAAGRLPSDRYADTLVALLDDPDDDVRLLAIEAMGAGRVKAAVAPLVTRLGDGDRNAIRIVWALGEIGDPTAVPALEAELADGDAFTRQACVEALGKIGGREALAPLMEAMLDPDPSVRKKAELALSR